MDVFFTHYKYSYSLLQLYIATLYFQKINLTQIKSGRIQKCPGRFSHQRIDPNDASRGFAE